MTFRLILFGIFTLSAPTVHTHDSGSAEINRIEVTPYFDTIIFSDVADVISEFENNMNPLEAFISSASESEENIEDLLSEYQHYLEKAHKQRTNYLEKTKVKNKVPMTRHDRYTKSKPAGGVKYDDYVYANGYFTQNTIPHSVVDFFIPVNTNKLRYLNRPEYIPLTKENHDDMAIEKKIIELPPIIPKSTYDPIKTSCLCKSGQVPCDCKPCKQCLFPMESMPQNYNQHNKLISFDTDSKGMLQNTDYTTEEKLRDLSDNTLNIRIKVDIQLPKTQEVFSKLYKNRSREDVYSKESAVNFPFPYFNFPIPMDLLGYKKPSKMSNHDSAHKITIHKKKKSRLNNSSKKHRNKKVIFHNLNVQPAKPQTYLEESYNTTDYNEKNPENSTSIQNSTIPDVITPRAEANNNVSVSYINNVNNTKDGAVINANETQTEESIFVMVNITNSADNGTDDVHKSENSVETQDTKLDTNSPTERLSNLRRKREIATETPKPLNSTETATSKGTTKLKDSEPATSTANPQILQVKNEDIKKIDKALLADTELFYWPDNNRDQTVHSSKNITTIILERENKKAKLNMSKEAIRSNHTRALERAIFGEVNWDDVDTVAPVFLSFVGKYLRGVLTFCSQNVCHSMKCAEKTCVHRICTPSDRWNQRGHCAGSNSTDSIASMESIMDLPSNVAFEIVDILQDKMLGKLFGKVTLCISTKCITFVVCKKNFLKSKCSVKELKLGHCPNIKNFKIM